MSRTRAQWVKEEKADKPHHVTMIEFAKTLGISESAFKRAVKSGGIPEPDAYTVSGWRLWSPEQVTETIRKRTGG